MSSLIATINRDTAGADDGNKSVCDGRTTACDLVGANGSRSADNAFAHVPGFASRHDRHTPRKRVFSAPRPVGSIAAAAASPAYAGDITRRQCDPSHIARRSVARLSYVFRDLTFADDNGLLPGAANPNIQEKSVTDGKCLRNLRAALCHNVDAHPPFEFFDL